MRSQFVISTKFNSIADDFLIGRFELFLDLLYVAILANFAESLADDVTGDNLVKYIVGYPRDFVYQDGRN